MKSSYWLFGIAVMLLTIGYIFTADQMTNHEVAYGSALIVIGLAVMASCRRTLPMQVENATLWMVILLFLSSYCVKFFLIITSPESSVTLGMVRQIGLGEFDYPTLAMEALLLSAAGITAFSVVMLAVPTVASHPRLLPLGAEGVGQQIITILFATALILSLGTGWLSYNYDIGLMGSDIKTILPYRLRGIVFYLRNYFLTGLLLLIIYLSFCKSYWYLAWFAIGLLLFNGVTDLAIRSSKWSILAPFLYLIFLIIASGFIIRKRHVAGAVGLSVPLFFILPYLHVLRDYRLAGQGVWESISSAVVSLDFQPVDFFLRGVVWIIYRLPGIDILIAILGHHASPVGNKWAEVFARPNGMASYLTHDVFLLPTSDFHLNAPGYFGWWYLFLGVSGVVVGGVVLGLIVRIVWPLTLQLAGHTAVLTRIFVLMLLFTALSEGILDNMLKMLLAMIFTVLTLEAFVRILVRFKNP